MGYAGPMPKRLALLPLPFAPRVEAVLAQLEGLPVAPVQHPSPAERVLTPYRRLLTDAVARWSESGARTKQGWGGLWQALTRHGGTDAARVAFAQETVPPVLGRIVEDDLERGVELMKHSHADNFRRRQLRDALLEAGEPPASRLPRGR